ncbi:hypothetical protein SH139x_003407 [Planctomycetaceae bacterium SH139]
MKRCLVRYGHLQRIDWFGTIHGVDCQRGQDVVVQNAEGRWLGQVLSEHQPLAESTATRSAQDVAANSAPVLRGELLRVSGREDQVQAARARELAVALRRAAAASSAPVIVVDTDVSLDRAVGLIQFVGTAAAALGPLAAHLAAEFGLSRIQWLPAQAVVAESPSLPDSSPASLPASLPAAVSALSVEDHVVDAIGSISGLLSQPATSETLRMARRYRRTLGLLGAYAQKLRPLPQSPELDRNELDRSGSISSGGISGGVHAGGTSSSAARRWMVRVKTTGGALTSGQFARLVGLAERFGDGTLRLTMRQGLQFHGVAWGRAGDLLAELAAVALTSRGSCGNTLRNVTCCPLQPRSIAALKARELASDLARKFLPQAAWLDYSLDSPAADSTPGNSITTDSQAVDSSVASSVDSAYPAGYLPHKWKIAVATRDDNCVNVLNNDLGLVVGVDQWEEQNKGQDPHHDQVWVDCYVGGSTAYRPGRVGSYPQLAVHLGRVRYERVAQLVTRLMDLHQRLIADGPRPQRRLKYLVQRLGIARLREAVGELLGPATAHDFTVALPAALPADCQSHVGWHASGAARWTLVLPVPTGRLGDASGQGLPALAVWQELVELGQWLRIGPQHTLVIGDISAAGRVTAEAWLRRHFPRETANLRVLTCVALPTCPLAVAAAERDYGLWYEVADQLAGEIRRLTSLSVESPLTVAVSGCANGCSHPLSVAMGVVAERTGEFRIFFGGSGVRMGIPLLNVDSPQQLLEQMRWIDRFLLRSRAPESDPPLVWVKQWLETSAGFAKFPWPRPTKCVF